MNVLDNRTQTLKILLANNLLKANDKLFFKVGKKTMHGVQAYYTATVTGNVERNKTVRWDFDNKEYSTTGLARKIVKSKREYANGMNGNLYWFTESGVDLWNLSQTFLNAQKKSIELTNKRKHIEALYDQINVLESEIQREVSAKVSESDVVGKCYYKRDENTHYIVKVNGIVESNGKFHVDTECVLINDVDNELNR